MNLRLLRVVIANSGLLKATVVFVLTFCACSCLLAVVEPQIGGVGNALWCCFEAVTTIGFGDVLVATPLGRAIVVLLSLEGIVFIAVLTGAAVNYSTELMRARRNESVALFLDKLEHLPELSQDELAQISASVKELSRKRD